MSMSREQLTENLKKYTAKNEKHDIQNEDCEIIELLLANCEITAPAESRFFCQCELRGRAGFYT